MRREDMFIDASAVSERKKGDIMLSYIEGHKVIQLLNSIYPSLWEFGEINLTLLGTRGKTKNDKNGVPIPSGTEVGYMCTGKLTINSFPQPLTFMDVGFGTGTSYSSQFDAHESAGKEAVTDCMKRCARNLGNAFGLALYDKNQEAVLSCDIQGYNKLMNLAKMYAPHLTNRLKEMQENYKTEKKIEDASQMSVSHWRALLEQMWSLYWDESF